MSLKALFEPESVAVVGASRKERKVGRSVLRNLVEYGFAGTIVPINPAADKMLGLPCYPSLTEYAQDVDLVVIALPQAQVKAVVEECVKVNAKGVIVLASAQALRKQDLTRQDLNRNW